MCRSVVSRGRPGSSVCCHDVYLQSYVTCAILLSVVGIQARQFVSMAFQPVVLSGPSGSGKSTLVKKLMEEYKDCFAFSVSRKDIIIFAF